MARGATGRVLRWFYSSASQAPRLLVATPMTRRRSVLVLGLGGLMLSAVSRVAVAGPTKFEAEGYAGSSVGQWTCGPTARANYGGVGGHVRVYTDDQPAATPPPEEQPDNGGALEADVDGAPPVAPVHAAPPEPPLVIEPYGFSLGAGGAGEHRSFTRIACNETPCSPKNDAIPSAQLLGAGRADLGYDLRYFGVRLGVMAFQRWENGYDSSPTTSVLPDIELRFARRAGFHAGVGFGAYDASTNFRPGGYHSLGYTGGGWDADLRVGGHLVFDGQAGLRVAASVRYALCRVVAPGLGVAISSAEQIAPEARLFLVFTP
jgi:hypothetical protein